MGSKRFHVENEKSIFANLFLLSTQNRQNSLKNFQISAKKVSVVTNEGMRRIWRLGILTSKN